MDKFLRWAGSKKQLLPRLRSFWSGRAKRYIEPFAGSASLFFSIEPATAILGDLNAELINALRSIQQDPYRVLECLRRLPVGKRAYYKIRGIQPSQLSNAESAARFLYLNFYCFNGLYRTNLQGEFNVPYGRIKGSQLINEESIIRSSGLLKRATLLCGDFEKTVRHATRGDLVYLDPPYVTRTGTGFMEYMPGSFAVKDLERLTATLDALDRRRVKFVVSYQDSAHARELLEPWTTYRVWTRRNIAGFTGSRRGVYELIATNIGANGVTNGH